MESKPPASPTPLPFSRNSPQEETCSGRPQWVLTNAVRGRRWFGSELAEVTGGAGPGGGHILGRGGVAGLGGRSVGGKIVLGRKDRTEHHQAPGTLQPKDLVRNGWEKGAGRPEVGQSPWEVAAHRSSAPLQFQTRHTRGMEPTADPLGTGNMCLHIWESWVGTWAHAHTCTMKGTNSHVYGENCTFICTFM